MISIHDDARALTPSEWHGTIEAWLARHPVGERVLLIPPDDTRLYSCAGAVTAWLYRRLCREHAVFVMPAVGTHEQMSPEACAHFFPGVPPDAFLRHDWRTDADALGVVPEAETERLTNGALHQPIEVRLNRRLTDGSFDTLISVGQVVPHEVVGMANYTKNLLVGLGGRETINLTHMAGALHGIESTLGRVDTPVRAIFDYAQQRFLDSLRVVYMLTVTTEAASEALLHGLYIGYGRDTFEAAAAQSLRKNVTRLAARARKVVAHLEPTEFKSAWVGNKAIYRTRMAIADGGELIIIAPGLARFGESDEVDRAIRAYGYCGTEAVMRLYRSGAFPGLDMVAAHLIHGSSEGRFRTVYATDPRLLDRAAVEQAGFGWMDVREALAVYRPEQRETGYVEQDGDAFYFVKAPATGLWLADS